MTSSAPLLYFVYRDIRAVSVCVVYYVVYGYHLIVILQVLLKFAAVRSLFIRGACDSVGWESLSCMVEEGNGVFNIAVARCVLFSQTVPSKEEEYLYNGKIFVVCLQFDIN